MTETLQRVATLHPEPGKQGVRIDARKYEVMRRALLRVIPARAPGAAFGDLCDFVRPLLPDDVYGEGTSVPWYVVTVKLDLEARGVLRRLPGRGPQRLVRRKVHP